MTRRFVKSSLLAIGMVLVAGPSQAQLTIEEVVPATAQAGDVLFVEIQGGPDCAFASFISTVHFSPATSITHDQVLLVEGIYNRVRTEITIPSDLPADQQGFQEVTVTTNAFDCVGADMFAVDCPGCTGASLISVDPSVGNAGEQVGLTIIGAGTNFGATSSLSFSGFGIQVDATNTVDSTTLDATVTIAPDAPTGLRDVTVTTGSEIAEGEDLFEVVCPDCTYPRLLLITPSTGVPGGVVSAVVTGTDTNFDDTSVLSFTGGGVTVLDSTVQDATTLEATIGIATDAPLGFRSATVTTGAEDATGADLFEVICEICTPARLLSVTPNSGNTGQTLDVRLLGEATSFDASTQVDFSGTGITVQTLTPQDANTLDATITIAADAPTGPRTVTATTGAEVVSATDAFTVDQLPFNLVPESGIQGQTIPAVTVTGGQVPFTAVTAVDLGSGVQIGSFNAQDDASLILTNVTVADDAPVGRRDLVLDLPGGAQTFAAAFAVLQGPDTLLLSVDPNFADRGHPGLEVAFTGQNTHFDATEVRVEFSGDGILAAPELVEDSTHMTARLVISDTAVELARDVSVSAGGACDWMVPAPCERVDIPAGFTITSPGSLDSATPAILPADSSVLVDFVATDGQFVQGETELVFDPPEGLAVVALVVQDADHLQAEIQIAATAPGDPRDVVAVTGPELALGPGLLDVDNPQLRNIIPPGGVQGQAGLHLLMTGIDIPFGDDTQVSFSGGDITVTQVTFDPEQPDNLAVRVDISPTAAIGIREVTITAGTIETTASDLFRVLAPLENKDDPGCSCASAPGGVGVGLIGLLVLVGLRRRRRI